MALGTVPLDPPPAHWAAKGAPVATEAFASESALRAGGEVAAPFATKAEWEFDVVTTAERTGSAAPANGELAGAGEDTGLVTHRGGCHCGAVRFEVEAPARIVAWDCNCSDCRMRRNLHFVVPRQSMRLICDSHGGAAGASALAEYRWGTGVARHLFCSRCGICPFYAPRSNPDGWAITFQCIDPGTVADVEVRRFDGRHWEDFIEGEGAAIRAFSKGDESAVAAGSS